MIVQKLAQGDVGEFVVGQQLLGQPKKTQDVEQHAPVTGPEQQAELGKQAGQPTATGILQGPVACTERKRHGAGLGGHTQHGQHPDQIRIVHRVVHDEPRVDVQGPIGRVDRDGIGMPAGRVSSFE